MKNINIGVTNEVTATCFNSKTEMDASKKPMNKEPESPKNILAGFELKNKKPQSVPAKMIAKIDTITLSKLSETIKKVNAEIAAKPEDNPSRPSIRLNAFVIATIQITVNGIDRKPKKIGSLKNGKCISVIQ
jgi:hypothetical protein